MRTLYSFSAFRCFLNLFFVGVFLLGAGEVRGSHLLGAELTYTCIGANLYRVYLTIYRDCNGVTVTNPQTVSWNGGTGCSGSFSVSRMSITDITPVPSNVLSRCAGGASGTLGMEKHVFQGTITFPISCTEITFRWSGPRNNGITSISNTQNLYITSYLKRSVSPCNSSPILNNPPLLVSCINQPVTYNLGAYNTDSDSLSYALVSCLEANNNPVNYIAGYSGTSFLGPNVPISLNPVTGDLTFTPITSATTVICIRVNEYRNGILIGSVVRDIQYSAYNCSNTAPTLSGINNTNNYTITTSVGSSLCFNVQGIDPNGHLITNMSLLNTNLSGASVSATVGNDTVNGTFCWTPNLGYVGTHNVYISVRDNGSPFTLQTVKTYTIHVVNSKIHGIVYQDLNSNCIQDNNEPGIPNRTITRNPGNATTTTNNYGVWSIASLPVGSYTVEVDTSNNWLSTCGTIRNFTVVNPNTMMVIPSFGLRSGNEPPLLSGIDSTANDTITVFANHNFCFNVYTIDTNGNSINSLVATGLPTGATFTTSLSSNTGIGTFCWTPNNSNIGTRTFQVSSQDNGNPLPAQIIKTYTIIILPQRISGYIYQDLNSNCIKDASDAGIVNRTLVINPGNIVVTTIANGYWAVDSLPAGNYTATVDTSNNWLPTCPIVQNFIVVSSSTITTGPSFGLISGNEPPLLSGTDSSNNYTITVFTNHTFCFNVYSIDTNGNSLNNIWAVGLPPGATFNTSLSNNTGIGTFCWSPNSSHVGTRTFQIYSQDNGAPLAAQTVKTYTIIVVPGNVYGLAYQDYNSNCVRNASEPVLANQVLLIDPGNIVVTTNAYGHWAVDSLPPGNYTLTSDTTSSWIPTCSIVQNFTVTNSGTVTITSFTGYISSTACPRPFVSVTPLTLRSGISGQILNVLVRNISTNMSLTNYYVIVEIDPLMTIQSGSLPYTSLGNNLYRVNIPTLVPTQIINFRLYFHLSSSAVINQTLCIGATAYPVNSCALDNIPNPYAPNNNISPCNLPWDNSSLQVDVSCDNDTVQFVVVNAGSGNMDCYAPVRVYLDGVWILSDSIQLQAGDSAVFRYSGDGRTWRLEADQHPLHPGNSRPNATIERCGNLANWTPNLVNILPPDDADPHVDINCRLVSAAYDPNDKTGYPLGVGNQHNIQPNQDLEYIINFQNTGNDTATTVVIRDTLPMDLNIFTVQSGASSHDYTFRMYGPRVLEWTFNNIMLPDSNVNEAASHGFTSFSVRQVPNLPVGTVIENSAAIYFDFNAPIITNTSWHTIAAPQDLNWNGQQTINTSSCGAYTLNNFTYTNSGTYWQTSNNGGLDSLFTVNLTILDSSSATISEAICNSYTAPDGQVYTTDGQYTAIIPNALGCDSVITINLDIKEPSNNTLNEAICNSYTAPDGQVYTTDGQYTAIIPNALGCDSVITINLDIKEPSNNTLNEAICNSYTAPDGQVYTTDGQYTAIIPNALGCDSVITINLDIKEPSNNTLSEAICNSYTAPDGQIYTTDGQYTAIIPNALGCDSVITINLDIKEPSNNTLSEAICNSYTAPDGQVYTTDGQYTAIIPNALGCDSVITINLDIHDSSSTVINETVCNSYTAPDGQVYTSSGQYIALINNTLGCDSTIFINLNIDNQPSDSISLFGTTLTAYAAGISYQWLDCNNGNAPIAGETNQSFTPLLSGDYAVEMTNGTCSVISNCFNVNVINLKNIENEMGILVYPNPTESILYIDKKNNEQIDFRLMDNLGRILVFNSSKEVITEIDMMNLPGGVYFISINTNNKTTTQKIVKQ